MDAPEGKVGTYPQSSRRAFYSNPSFRDEEEGLIKKKTKIRQSQGFHPLLMGMLFREMLLQDKLDILVRLMLV